MKKTIALLIAASVVFPISSGTAFAQEGTPAEKAIQGVKDSVGALIDAKDNNDPREALSRLDAYEKVLDLTVADTKELKLKLLSFDGDKDKPTSTAALWKKNRVEALNAALKRYEDEEDALSAIENPSVENIKAQAGEFKEWRENEYLPLADEIQAFLLIEQQKRSLETAQKRLEKVNVDVAKLKKVGFKDIRTIESRYKDAETLIADSRKLNDSAERNFQKYYLLQFMGKSDPLRVAFQKEIDDEKAKLKGAGTASSTPPYPPSPSSIKDLVDGSFTKVKGAYQVFIEMSDLVRRSL